MQITSNPLTAACIPLLLVLVTPKVVQAQYTWSTNADATITILGYEGLGGALTIPRTINGLPVTGIGGSAFGYNASLASVTIGPAVTFIRIGAFSGCTALTNFTVETLNPAYSSLDGVLFNKNQDTLVRYPAGKSGDYLVPNGTTSIGDEAFSGCAALTSAILRSSVAIIGDYAFEGCAGLKSVTLGNGLASLGAGAFFGCAALTNAILPSSVADIGRSAFQECTGLKSVTLGNGLASLGIMAFADCTNLTSVTIPASVTNIVANFFKVGHAFGSFADCVNLTNIAVDPLNTTYGSLDGVVYSKSKDTLVTYPPGKGGVYAVPDSVTSIGVAAFGGCTGLTSVTMGNRVTDIGSSAFFDCVNLTSVTIPDGVTSIGYTAFWGCGSLTNVTIGNGVTNIADGAFYGTGLEIVFFAGNAPAVGDHLVNTATVYYLPGTSGWGPTFAGRPAVLWNPTMRVSEASFSVRPNSFGFNIAGTARIPLAVEASTDLAKGVWVPVATFTLTNGLVYFSDPNWTNHPARFYRIRSP